MRKNIEQVKRFSGAFVFRLRRKVQASVVRWAWESHGSIQSDFGSFRVACAMRIRRFPFVGAYFRRRWMESC